MDQNRGNFEEREGTNYENQNRKNDLNNVKIIFTEYEQFI